MNTETTTVPSGLALGGRVLFVIPDNHQEDNVFPMGPGYLAAVLRDNGVTVETYCMDLFHHSNEDLVAHLTANTYDLVCMGYMGPRFKRGVQDTCRTIARAKSPECWFVIGGYGPSSCVAYMTRESGADVLVVGEGEVTLIEVMQARLGLRRLDDVRGVAFLRADEVVTTPRRPPIRDIGELPFPAWDLFPMDRYTTCLKFARMAETDRAFPISSSRGCTDRCSFCFRLDASIRVRKPPRVVAEMKELNQRWGINYFYFVDELAVVSRPQILALCALIKRELPPIKFRMDCRVTLFDDEIAAALHDAGCVFLNIGFESSSQQVLDQMNKRATVEQNIAAAETAIRHDIGIGINMIWGMPGDTLETMRANAAFIKRFNQYDQIRTIRPVTPYPGSPLFDRAVAMGVLDGPADFYAKFKNSDLYLVNFIGLPEDEIYQALYEVNRELLLDHFRHTNGDLATAEAMAQAFHDLYFCGATDFSGPRHLTSNRHLRPESAPSSDMWDQMPLQEGSRLSGM